jgi:hypothetical protein
MLSYYNTNLLIFQGVEQSGVNASEDRDPFDEDDVNFTEAVVENSGGWAENTGKIKLNLENI